MTKTLTVAQKQSFDQVMVGLGQLGYSQGYVRRNYEFEDWFDPGTPKRSVDAVAFAQKPFAYDTACFAVVASNGTEGPERMRQIRALGPHPRK